MDKAICVCAARIAFRIDARIERATFRGVAISAPTAPIRPRSSPAIFRPDFEPSVMGKQSLEMLPALVGKRRNRTGRARTARHRVEIPPFQGWMALSRAAVVLSTRHRGLPHSPRRSTELAAFGSSKEHSGYAKHGSSAKWRSNRSFFEFSSSNEPNFGVNQGESG